MERAAQQRGLDLVVLSLDVVLNPVTADLRNPKATRHWLDRILQGQVCGLAAGPPCNTWSHARRLNITCCGLTLQAGVTCPTVDDAHHDHYATPHTSLDGLRARERRAPQLANHLYRSTLLLATAC